MNPSRYISCFVVLLHMSVHKILCDETAFVEIIIYEHSGGDYTTQTYNLKGQFSVAGEATSAEGDIEQVHPLGLCNTSSDGKWKKYGWVGIVKLTVPDEDNPPCFTLFEKARRAIQRGATAIIFDVTDNPRAAGQLNSAKDKIGRPVIIIDGQDAEKLMNVANNDKVSARARIQYTTAGYTPQRAANEYFDMIIFMTFFIVVSIVCFILLLKIKWKQKQKESSLTRMALHAISRMETRKYSLPPSDNSNLNEDAGEISDSSSTDSIPVAPSIKCVICLEKFQEGQDVRIVPCRHEFHKSCVDPWLLSNYTCPLCMLNIVEREHTKNKRRQRGWFSGRCARCFSNNSLSSVGSTGSVLQNVLGPSRINSVEEISNHNESLDLASSSLSLSQDSQEHVELSEPSSGASANSSSNSNDFVINIGCRRASSGKSLCSSSSSIDGHSLKQNVKLSSSSAILGKDYTHQVVVVAPITAAMADGSQEDIV